MDRRQFVGGALLGASALALASPRTAWSGVVPQPKGSEAKRTTLSVVRRMIEVNGRPATVFGLQQPDRTSGLSLPAGEMFDVVLRNETDEPTIVHWHGLTPPWDSDGVGGAPLPLLAPGADRDFSFPVGAAGTHWMHAHTLQEQTLLAAPLIVRGAEDQARDEQDVVILLHDFSFTSPEELLERLKSNAGAHVSTGAAGSAMPAHAAGHGDMPGMKSKSDMPSGGGVPMDLNDIEYDAYLANDRTLDDPEIVPVEPGGRVRLRIINGATATAFTVDVGELEGTLFAVDGQDVEPIQGRRFPLAMGQRIDVRVSLPREPRSFPVLALREGAPERTGIVLRPARTPVAKLPPLGSDGGPVVDLSLEGRLRARAPLTSRPVDKAFAMHLTGAMQEYRWGLETPVPITVQPGDRVEVTMRNISMMAHPMHLHGHHFQVVAIDGVHLAGAVRDTVHIPPMRSVTIAVDADNAGEWAFHCHHLYHMAAGMMARFTYAA